LFSTRRAVSLKLCKRVCIKWDYALGTREHIRKGVNVKENDMVDLVYAR